MNALQWIVNMLSEDENIDSELREVMARHRLCEEAYRARMREEAKAEQRREVAERAAERAAAKLGAR